MRPSDLKAVIADAHVICGFAGDRANRVGPARPYAASDEFWLLVCADRGAAPAETRGGRISVASRDNMPSASPCALSGNARSVRIVAADSPVKPGTTQFLCEFVA
jgi:hypothetical protein